MILDVVFEENEQEIIADFGEVVEVKNPDADIYGGEYQVTPKVTEQTLPTAQKFLVEDVTIKKIPYFEVSNEAGGNTVYIGKEV
jgi:hypothetical protein